MKAYHTGQRVELVQEIARSGQGTVYSTTIPGVLAKLYTSSDDLYRFEKLKVMVALPPSDPTQITLHHKSIAWPNDLIVQDSRCVGFLMPHIENSRELTHVYNPVLRNQHAPKFNWFYLHSTAYNYVSALEAIHARGYVIGDIKPQNVLVNQRALISIIDTDSFQVINPESGLKYRCPVGSEGYTPPELLAQLIGKKFTDVDRTEIHDRFGMAVIVYLLLFGRHPFSEGRWRGEGDPPGPDERVLRGLWLHHPNGEIGRDPGTIPLKIVHPRVEQCLRRCFIDGFSEPTLRPTAMEWKQALKAALDDLTHCQTEPNHYFSQHFATCYWCFRRDELGVDIFNPNARVPPRPPAPRISMAPLRPAPVMVQIRGWRKWIPAPRARNIGFLAPLVVLIITRFLSTHLTTTTPISLPVSSLSTRFNASFIEPWSQISPRLTDDKKSEFWKLPDPFHELLVAGGSQKKNGYIHVLFVIVRQGTIEPSGSDALMLVTYPVQYDVTGRETTIAVQGHVYVKDLGPGTTNIIENMSSFALDSTWTMTR